MAGFKAPVVHIVVPCFNEEAGLRRCADILGAKVKALVSSGSADAGSRVLFVNDGSDDATWNIIEKLHNSDRKLFCGISLSRRCGQQNALMAGLMASRCLADAVITIDADIQDDPEAIDAMLAEFRAGSQVVYGVRKSRSSDGIIKRATASAFYRLMPLLGAEITPQHADFRLMGARALDCLAQYGETNLFVRGIAPLVGFKSSRVYYDRLPRIDGHTSYTLINMISLAFDCITSFSIRPLRLISALGFVIFFVGLAVLIWSLATKFFGYTVRGWTSLIVSIWTLGGLQLLAIGLVGEYVGRTYMEAKRRPRWFVAEELMERDAKR